MKGVFTYVCMLSATGIGYVLVTADKWENSLLPMIGALILVVLATSYGVWVLERDDRAFNKVLANKLGITKDDLEKEKRKTKLMGKN